MHSPTSPSRPARLWEGWAREASGCLVRLTGIIYSEASVCCETLGRANRHVALRHRPGFGREWARQASGCLVWRGGFHRVWGTFDIGVTATIEREVRADPLMRQTGGDVVNPNILADLTGYLQQPGIVQFEQVYHCIHELISTCPPPPGAFDEFRPLMLPFLNDFIRYSSGCIASGCAQDYRDYLFGGFCLL